MRDICHNCKNMKTDVTDERFCGLALLKVGTNAEILYGARCMHDDTLMNHYRNREETDEMLARIGEIQQELQTLQDRIDSPETCPPN